MITTKTTTDYSYGIIPVRKEGDDFKFLISQHRGGYWTFPKGHKEGEETDLEAAKREMREETGLEVSDVIEDKVFKVNYIPVHGRQGFIDKVVSLFIGFPEETFATIPIEFAHEIEEARWCGADEAKVLFVRDEWKNVLDEVVSYLSIHEK